MEKEGAGEAINLLHQQLPSSISRTLSRPQKLFLLLRTELEKPHNARKATKHFTEEERNLLAYRAQRQRQYVQDWSKKARALGFGDPEIVRLAAILLYNLKEVEVHKVEIKSGKNSLSLSSADLDGITEETLRNLIKMSKSSESVSSVYAEEKVVRTHTDADSACVRFAFVFLLVKALRPRWSTSNNRETYLDASWVTKGDAIRIWKKTPALKLIHAIQRFDDGSNSNYRAAVNTIIQANEVQSLPLSTEGIELFGKKTANQKREQEQVDNFKSELFDARAFQPKRFKEGKLFIEVTRGQKSSQSKRSKKKGRGESASSSSQSSSSNTTYVLKGTSSRSVEFLENLSNYARLSDRQSKEEWIGLLSSSSFAILSVKGSYPSKQFYVYEEYRSADEFFAEEITIEAAINNLRIDEIVKVLSYLDTC